MADQGWEHWEHKAPELPCRLVGSRVVSIIPRAHLVVGLVELRQVLVLVSAPFRVRHVGSQHEDSRWYAECSSKGLGQEQSVT